MKKNKLKTFNIRTKKVYRFKVGKNEVLLCIPPLVVRCHNPTLRECEDETHTPEMGTWESSGTPKISEYDCRGQNTSHWGVLNIIGKLLKCRCLKWARMNHLDICSTSYGKKEGKESNWQFDVRPLKVRNRLTIGKLSTRATSLLQTSSQSEV
jgi:hypothetical protein